MKQTVCVFYYVEFCTSERGESHGIPKLDDVYICMRVIYIVRSSTFV